MTLRITIVLLLAALHTLAQADTRGAVPTTNPPGAAGKTYAIVIGISKYKNVRPLQYADKDAEAFSHFLQSASGGNIPPDNIETFINEKATRENVGDAISGFVRKARPGDRIYFFFAGHGDMEDLTQIENGLLLLYNSPNGNYFGMNDDVLEVLDLKRYLSPLSERGIEVYFIVDACHSGNLKGGVQGMQQTASALAASWGREFKILSCQPNQLSLESKEWGGGRGLFSLKLEEGMEGMADRNGDKKVSLLELQQYITEKVATISEGTQIPVVLGDLSKNVATVDTVALAALRRRITQDFPMLAVANTKGTTDVTDSLDPVRARLYKAFETDLEKKALITPANHNALADYRAVERLDPDHPLVKSMRRTLAAALNELFNHIVAPMLQGKTTYTTRDSCALASAELDSCLHILGEQHYMYSNIKARQLYIEAIRLSWTIVDVGYYLIYKPMVDSSIDLLEQSEKLEPNAAYTLMALGTRYSYVYDFDKANIEFSKYLTLRPNDRWAKYSLAEMYRKLKWYPRAEALLKELIAEAGIQFENAYSELSSLYMDENKPQAAFELAKEVVKLDSRQGYFMLAVFYSERGNIDSAKKYYRLYDPKCSICNNNIGYAYLINGQLDSATHYFNMIKQGDADYAFKMFNLGTIDALKRNYDTAVSQFVDCINTISPLVPGFISRPDIYFGKRYTVIDSADYKGFQADVFEISLQYEAYASILYCFMRARKLDRDDADIDYWFGRMKRYKEYDFWTYYHYACYMALRNRKDAAIDNLKKAMAAGFINHFLLTSDDDLAGIRDTPEFKALLKQYFP